MHSINCKVIEIFLDGNVTARIKFPSDIRYQTGQYFLFRKPHQAGQFPSLRFTPGKSLGSTVDLIEPVPEWFYPGASLLVDGPLGIGFSIPSGTNKLLLFSTKKTAGLVLSLATDKRQVCLIQQPSNNALNSSIEILTPLQLPETLKWADFCAIETEKFQFAKLQDDLISLGNKFSLPPIQIHISTDMPCNGVTSCGICAIKNRQGRVVSLCTGGPVINF